MENSFLGGKTMKVAMWGFVVFVVCIFLYGSFWFAKNVSYWLWYEEMVKETVIEMVKPEALLLR